VKVLLDECVDWRLARDLGGHEVTSAHQMGWAGIQNGELLTLAAREFEAFITMDRNLSFQQNLVSFPIVVIVLRAKTNRLADLRPLCRASWLSLIRRDLGSSTTLSPSDDVPELSPGLRPALQPGNNRSEPQHRGNA
jgi:hypothetical protein